MREAGAQCGTLAVVPVVIHHAVHEAGRFYFGLQLLARAIHRAVVDHDDFLVGVW
jgi:hypothetical protein